MTWNGLYAFDGETMDLSLLPMAARRALDVAGVHLSLEGFRKLPLHARARLVELGASDTVSVDEVRACLQPVAASLRAQPGVPDPSPRAVPDPVTKCLGAGGPSSAEWSSLHALDRYVLAKLAAGSRFERLVRAMIEIRARSD